MVARKPETWVCQCVDKNGSMRVYVRVAKRLVHEPHLPRPLRALLVFALLPIPGPVDELALLAAAVTIAVFYRPRFKALVQEERSNSARIG